MPVSDNIHTAKFKSKAKSLQKSVKAGDQAASRRIAPYFNLSSEFKLTQAQLVIAREHRCSSWKQLVSRDNWVQCSFCGKWEYELKKLIAGPNVYVCDECVEFCNGIIQDEISNDSDAHA